MQIHIVCPLTCHLSARLRAFIDFRIARIACIGPVSDREGCLNSAPSPVNVAVTID
jgi:hypothetical protein